MRKGISRVSTSCADRCLIHLWLKYVVYILQNFSMEGYVLCFLCTEASDASQPRPHWRIAAGDNVKIVPLSKQSNSTFKGILYRIHEKNMKEKKKDRKKNCRNEWMCKHSLRPKQWIMTVEISQGNYLIDPLIPCHELWWYRGYSHCSDKYAVLVISPTERGEAREAWGCSRCHVEKSPLPHPLSHWMLAFHRAQS